ncbi:MAG TPA: hypothetical protein VGM24_05275 [Puia sp.]
MVFELISWIYISIICLIWGNGFVRLIFRGGVNISELDLPVLCFVGLSVIGVVSLYLSLFIPLNGWVKGILQVPVLLYFLSSSNRITFFNQVKNAFAKLAPTDRFLLIAGIVMLLFLSSSPVIHPDSLNYHIYSIQIFNKYGMIRGIANLQPELGFQSLWFGVMSVFDLSFFQPAVSYPLSACVLCWFIIFLVSGSVTRGARAEAGIPAFWYLALLIFAFVSWTQVRLTASSASPDFIVSLCLLLSFYFFTRKALPGEVEFPLFFALFFAVIAISIKLSAIFIILLPAYVLVYGAVTKKFFLVRSGLLLITLFLAPVIARNIISAGYPLYPSAFADVFHGDWKPDESKLILFRHYITDYARYPVSRSVAEGAYAASFQDWLPVWWRHLYIIDKIMMLLIVCGGLADLILLRKWLKNFTARRAAAFVISLTGAVCWFINAPDPRFGTGFLLPLIYFQYAPFLISGKQWFYKITGIVKFSFTLLIVTYIVYRGIYFFHPGQLIFPEGIKESRPASADCRYKIKRMLFRDSAGQAGIADSCRTFIFRGSSLKEGFKPAE